MDADQWLNGLVWSSGRGGYARQFRVRVRRLRGAWWYGREIAAVEVPCSHPHPLPFPPIRCPSHQLRRLSQRAHQRAHAHRSPELAVYPCSLLPRALCLSRSRKPPDHLACSSPAPPASRTIPLPAQTRYRLSLAMRRHLPFTATPRPHCSPRPSPPAVSRPRYPPALAIPIARHTPFRALCICRARSAPPPVHCPSVTSPSRRPVHSTERAFSRSARSLSISLVTSLHPATHEHAPLYALFRAHVRPSRTWAIPVFCPSATPPPAILLHHVSSHLIFLSLSPLSPPPSLPTPVPHNAYVFCESA